MDPRIDTVASDIKIEQIESCYIAPDPFESEIGNILNVKPVPMPVQPQWQSEITVKTNFLGWALLHGNIAVEYDIIKKSGSWFSYGDSKLAQGREAVKNLLTDNIELCDEIEAKIREALKNVQD